MIEAHAITKSFGTTKALDGVDVVADAGRVLALLGPNGAGKTTIVRILTTLLAADSGWAKVAGLDVVKDAVELRHLIGVTGQFAAIDLLLTGRENLEMVGELSQLPRPQALHRADELLEQFDLVDAADRQARTYSGGMRRRLDLAASLIANPPVLVLDEPTTGLDPRTRSDVWAAVDRLVEGGTTVLLTTQYLEEADRLAHRIVVIDRGRVVAEGTADELKGRLGGDVVEVHLSRPDEIDMAFAALDLRDAGAMDRARQRLTLPAPDGVATLRVTLDRLDEVGVGVDEIGLRRPSLDDVFLAFTGHSVSSDDCKPPDSARARKRRRRSPHP